MKIEEKLEKMGIKLKGPTAPVANYVPSVRTGNLVFLSGHGPFREDGSMMTGKVGVEVSLEEAYETAKRVAIGLLGSLKAEIGDLDKVKTVREGFGYGQCRPGFHGPT